MKKLLTILLSLLLVFTLFTGCGGDATEEAATPKEGQQQEQSQEEQQQEESIRDDLIIALSGEPFGLVPQVTNDGYSSQFEMQLYSALLTKDNDGKVVGDIAESWEASDDYLTYTFKIRKDVKFHNGESLTAEDVKFTFDLGMESPQVADLFAVFESVEIIDDYTIKVNLKFKYAPLLEKLSYPNTAGIICKKTYEEVGQEHYVENPIGTGPYKIKSWEKGIKIILESFEEYYKKPASIKEVTIRFIPDPTTATIAIESGEIDMTDNVSIVDLEAISNDIVGVYESPSTHFNWVAINTSIAPFNDAKVRKAIEYAIDKESVIIAALEGHGTVAETIAFDGILGYDPTIGGNEYNPEKAKELLAEAGYSNGIETTMLALGGYTSVVAETVQANLMEVGINVEIQNMEPSAFLQDILGGNYDISFLASDSLTYDPEQIYQRLHPQGTYSVSLYDNAELNKELEIILQESDETQRANSVVKVQKIFKEEVPLVPLFWRNKIVLANKNLVNADKMNKRFEIYKLSWKK